MSKKETAEEFVARLMALPDPDLSDKETVRAFSERLDKRVRPEIEKQDRLQANSLSRAFSMVVR